MQSVIYQDVSRGITHVIQISQLVLYKSVVIGYGEMSHCYGEPSFFFHITQGVHLIELSVRMDTSLLGILHWSKQGSHTCLLDSTSRALRVWRDVSLLR